MGRRGRLRLLLAEASLELAPREIWGHPEVRRTAERYGILPGMVVLDKSLHYNAMARLPYKWKRGRPDILHVTLLNILDSPLADEGRLEIMIHTIEGRLFRVDPSTRIPKHYDRFKGLMAQLLVEGRVPPRGRPLIWEVEGPLGRYVRSAILLDEGGEPSTPRRVALDSLAGAWIIVGVYPSGSFSPAVRRLAARRVSIYGGRPLKAWTVVSRILCHAEEILGYTVTTGHEGDNKGRRG